jgi:hypothetical protein
MTPTYAAGELVDITIRGARVLPCDVDGVLAAEYTIRLPAHEGAWRRVSVCTESDSVTVERVAPAEWPPRIGDLWRDRADNLWFGTPNSHNEDLWLIGSTGQGDHASSLLRNNGPLALVLREPAPADTEGGES